MERQNYHIATQTVVIRWCLTSCELVVRTLGSTDCISHIILNSNVIKWHRVWESIWFEILLSSHKFRSHASNKVLASFACHTQSRCYCMKSVKSDVKPYCRDAAMQLPEGVKISLTLLWAMYHPQLPACLHKMFRYVLLTFMLDHQNYKPFQWYLHLFFILCIWVFFFSLLQVSKLPNGLVIASLENNSSSSSVGVFVKAGSRFETVENQGVSHVLRLAANLVIILT